MRMLALLIVASGACLVLAGCAAPVGPPSEPSVPPPEPRTMPGVVKGRVKTRWLAPFVSVTTRSLGGKGTTTVQWFRPIAKLVLLT